MTRIILAAFAALLIAPTSMALAADDGGFGSQRFTNQAPSALSDTNSDALATAPVDPATIEPAAGNDEADADAGLEVEEAPSAIPAEPDKVVPAPAE